jgi:hypothetical protein
MKKLGGIIIVLLVSVCWLVSAKSANAQTEIERLQTQISELESFAEVCSGVNDKLVPPGPTASAEDWKLYEFQLWSLEYCVTDLERKLNWMRARLGELLSRLPSVVEPEERKKRRTKIKEWEEAVAAAEVKQRRIREKLRKLRKALKPKPPAPGFTVEDKSSNGLTTVSFSTPQGKLNLNLPEKKSAGDTISGTVIAEPTGQTEAERANNLNQLWRYVLEIDGKPIRLVSDSQTPNLGTSTILNFTTEMSIAPPSDLRTTTLKDKDGVEKAECTLWRDPTNPPGATTTGPKQFQFPTTSQNGRPLEIVGPFDGKMNTTEIKIGGQAARVLAESPNSCIVKAPDQNFGPTEITVKEGDVEAKGSCRNLGLRLAAPKTSLLKGETTVLTITVEGLKGIQQDVPMLLQKQGVVSMEGGDTQTVQIRPADVRADGTFETKRTLTGLQAGAFGVTATVVDPARRPLIIPLIENAKVNGFRVRKDGDKFVIEVEGVQSPITGKPVDGEHKLEHQCPTLSKVPYLGRLFLNKGSGKADAQCLMLIVTPTIIIQDEE